MRIGYRVAGVRVSTGPVIAGGVGLFGMCLRALWLMLLAIWWLLLGLIAAEVLMLWIVGILVVTALAAATGQPARPLDEQCRDATRRTWSVCTRMASPRR